MPSGTVTRVSVSVKVYTRSQYIRLKIPLQRVEYVKIPVELTG